MLTITSSVTINSASWGRASDLSGGSSAKNSEDMKDLYYDQFDLLYFKACLFATILEDSMNQIRILEECNSEIRIMKTMSEINKLLADKFNVPKKPATDELDEIDSKKLGCMEYKLEKLQNDRKFLMKVLLGTYLDLSKYRRCCALSNHVSDITHKYQHLDQLIEEEGRNRILRRETNRQLRQQRNHIKSVTYDTNMIIEDLRNRVEDAALNVEIRGRYTANWQNARCEQNSQVIRDKESPSIGMIDYYKQRTEQEHRVHSEVELLISIFINEILEKVEYWMAKYEKDIEKMDLKIQLMKNDHENMEKRRIGLEEKLKVQAEEMKQWVEFKEKREAERLHREKMHKAAVSVQAWWRGLLVRNELGPYKPVKRRPGALEEKDKKDKKKKK